MEECEALGLPFLNPKELLNKHWIWTKLKEWNEEQEIEYWNIKSIWNCNDQE